MTSAPAQTEMAARGRQLREGSEACPFLHGVSGRGRTQTGAPERSEPSGVVIARSRAIRWWLVMVGVACVALGAVGVIVPGLPTTVFLLIASWCFVRSCPVLERVLIRNRFFAPFVRYLQPGAVMPTRARVVTTIVMWVATVASAALLFERGVHAAVPVCVVLAAAVGTIAVWRVARAPRAA